MFTAAELAEHRADAESLMGDTYAAFAPATPARAANGLLIPQWTPMGTTPGKTQGTAARDTVTRHVIIGNTEFDVVDGGLHIPTSQFVVDGALQVRIGWEFQCIAVDDRSDPAGLNRRWHVANVPAKTWITARRFDVAEVPPLTL